MLVTCSLVVKELLALHETFRRLKYPAKNLFVGVGGPVIQFIAKSNDKEFTINVADSSDAPDIVDEWKRATIWWNKEATEEQRISIFENSSIFHKKMDLLTALAVKEMIHGE